MHSWHRVVEESGLAMTSSTGASSSRTRSHDPKRGLVLEYLGGTPTLPSRLGFLSTADSRATSAGPPGMFNVPSRWARPLCQLGLFHATKCHQQASRTAVKWRSDDLEYSPGRSGAEP